MARLGISMLAIMAVTAIYFRYSEPVTVPVEAPKAPASVGLPTARTVAAPGTAIAETPSQKVGVQPAPVSPEASFPFDGKLQASLEASQKMERDWIEARTRILAVDLHLGEAKISLIETARNNAASEETRLLAMESSSDEAEERIREELKANRTNYQNALKRIVGKDGFKQLLRQYRAHWKVNASSGSHQVLL